MTTELSWEVKTMPVMVNDQIVSGYKSLVRSDNGEILNICKNSYTPTLNSRLIDFSTQMTEVLGFEHMGYSEIQGGKKVITHLKNADSKFVVADCPIEDYLMIGNSHDGSHAFWIGSNTNMLRCANQYAKRFRELSVYHTKHHDVRIEEVMSMFKVYQDGKNEMKKQLEKMTKVKVSEKLLVSLSERLFQVEMVEERLAEISQRKVNQIYDFMDSVEAEMSDLGTNLFGVFNGVTHYTTHKTKQSENIFGKNFNFNQEAYSFCLEQLN